MYEDVYGFLCIYLGYDNIKTQIKNINRDIERVQFSLPEFY